MKRGHCNYVEKKVIYIAYDTIYVYVYIYEEKLKIRRAEEDYIYIYF